MQKIMAASSRISSILHDEEFGDIEIRRVQGSVLRVKIQTSGKLIAQLPHFTSVREVSKLVEKSRENLRSAIRSMPTKKSYSDRDKIGRSHILRIRTGIRENSDIRGLEIIVIKNAKTTDSRLETLIKDGVAKALRREAKAYLPRRLKYFQMKYADRGIKYDRVRFTHAKSRWGSCSTSGTISLNIMLMTLPEELSDYVLLHELNHTIHMDHSQEFWSDLEEICPRAKAKRKMLREYSPYL